MHADKEAAERWGKRDSWKPYCEGGVVGVDDYLSNRRASFLALPWLRLPA